VGVSRDCPIFWVPLLSQERVKLRTSNFVGTFIGSIGTKAHENVGNSGSGRSQESRKFSGTHMYCRAQCAVIFAIAQVSCLAVAVVMFSHSDKSTGIAIITARGT